MLYRHWLDLGLGAGAVHNLVRNYTTSACLGHPGTSWDILECPGTVCDNTGYHSTTQLTKYCYVRTMTEGSHSLYQTCAQRTCHMYKHTHTMYTSSNKNTVPNTSGADIMYIYMYIHCTCTLYIYMYCTCMSSHPSLNWCTRTVYCIL